MAVGSSPRLASEGYPGDGALAPAIEKLVEPGLLEFIFKCSLDRIWLSVTMANFDNCILCE